MSIPYILLTIIIIIIESPISLIAIRSPIVCAIHKDPELVNLMHVTLTMLSILLIARRPQYQKLYS